MVLTLAIPLRAVYGLNDFVTDRHLDNMAKVMLVAGLIVAYGYVMEIFVAFYSGHEAERFMVMNRIEGRTRSGTGCSSPATSSYRSCSGSRAVRANVIALFAISIVVNVGMWLERFIITVVSLHRDFLPSSWEMYSPTFWDWSTYIGTLGLFVGIVVPVRTPAADHLDFRDAGARRTNRGRPPLSDSEQPPWFEAASRFRNCSESWGGSTIPAS